MERPPEIDFDHFLGVDMRVGRVLEVEDFPEARKPAWKLRIDFGPEIGEKRSSAQITSYSREELEGTLVVGVVNFPPRQIGPVRSEVLVLGALSEAGRGDPPAGRRREAGGPDRRRGLRPASPGGLGGVVGCVGETSRSGDVRVLIGDGFGPTSPHGHFVADQDCQRHPIRSEAGE